jgi:hypothetical protein
MTKNTEKTVLRDSGNGQFIAKGQAARKPRNTWQKERRRAGIRTGNRRIAAIERGLVAGGGTNTSRSAGFTAPAWRKSDAHERLGRIERKIDNLKNRIDALSTRVHKRN